MVVTLPFVLLLLDYWPLLRWQSRDQLFQMLREKTPLFVLSAAACVASAFVPGLLIESSHQLPFPERVGNAVVSAVVYVRQMVCPAGLAALYPIVPRGPSAADICAALFILTAITIGFVVCRKPRPYLLAGWLWYLGMLVPVLGIVQISYNAAHADRFTYLAQIGLIMAATWAIRDWSAARKLRKMILAGLAAAVLVALTVCGHNQTAFWRDSGTLWRHALACTVVRVNSFFPPAMIAYSSLPVRSFAIWDRTLRFTLSFPLARTDHRSSPWLVRNFRQQFAALHRHPAFFSQNPTIWSPLCIFSFAPSNPSCKQCRGVSASEDRLRRSNWC
jgi:hypothetical protein